MNLECHRGIHLLFLVRQDKTSLWVVLLLPKLRDSCLRPAMVCSFTAVAVKRAVSRPLPAQIPACGFPAPGSSDSLACATCHYRGIYAIPHSEVCLDNPNHHHDVRSRFPLWAMTACQPLPLVSNQSLTRERPYRLRVLWADRGAKLRHSLAVIGLPTWRFGSAYLALSQEPPGSPKFLYASLHTSHALSGPRQTLRALTISRALCVGFWHVNTIAICI